MRCSTVAAFLPTCPAYWLNWAGEPGWKIGPAGTVSTGSGPALSAGASDEAMPPYVMMTIWALFDNGDKIIEIALHQADEIGVIYELETIFLDEFDVLRDHPDFPQFLSAIGLTDYWNSVGCAWQTQQLVCDVE
jgi:hypothetical protein